ncbi:ABC transporter ATP-binding protein [Brunnivagina elsteri]|nr:ATP-binding cassette domain-containing protein [Calothrix elsteri]
MIFLFLCISLLEVIGTGAIGPFISLATNLENIEQNYWLNWVYSNLKFTSKNQYLLTVGFLVIIIFYVKSFLSFKAQKLIFKFSFGQQGELSLKLMRLYLAAPYTFHINRNSATLIQNIINETSKFVNGLMIPLLVSISNAAVIMALIALLIFTNAMATLMIALILLIGLLLFHNFKDRLGYWGKEGSESSAEMIRLVNHGLGGIKETRVIGCESYFEEKLQKQAQRFGDSVSLAVSFSNLPRYVIEPFLITFIIIFTFLFLAFDKDNYQNLSSILGVFALASIRLLPATSNLLSSVNTIKYNTISLEKIYLEFKDLEQASENKFTTIIDSKTESKLAISFENIVSLNSVVYCYPNASKNALEGIDIEIKKGNSIGLIGKSGSGKTTLVDVILGLLTPQHGDIKVDGVSIYDDLRAWQNLIGYVPQSIFLIDDTIEKNIAFGVADDAIDHERLYNAIESAQLTELIKQLPDGIKTVVGERGVLLSGGQRQRVGIARALYHEREILVFDEATAALDNETEALVTESIRALSGIKTMIIIAHRLSTIEHCDRIYMLQNGRVLKSGSYQEVVMSK